MGSQLTDGQGFRRGIPQGKLLAMLLGPPSFRAPPPRTEDLTARSHAVHPTEGTTRGPPACSIQPKAGSPAQPAILNLAIKRSEAEVACQGLEIGEEPGQMWRLDLG